MEEYTYSPIAIVIHWYIRLRNWLVSKRDNRSLYKQFTTDLHLDKLEKEEISFKLPEKYPIVTSEIKHLYNVRDEIIIKLHDKDYTKKQIAIDNRIKEYEGEYELLRARRIEEKQNYDKLRAKLRATKNSEDIIALQTRVNVASTKLDNTDAAIESCKNHVSELLRTRKMNLENWTKQVKLVEKTIDDAIIKYIERSTKKIKLSYGFTDFTYEEYGYENELQKIVRGEY